MDAIEEDRAAEPYGRKQVEELVRRAAQARHRAEEAHLRADRLVARSRHDRLLLASRRAVRGR